MFHVWRKIFRLQSVIAITPIVLAASVLLPIENFSASAADTQGSPVLVSGTVLDGSGPSAKSFVQAYTIDPDALKPQQTPMTPVASAVAANDGTFSLNAAPTKEMKRLADENDGWVNLMVYSVEHKNGKTFTQDQIMTRLLPGSTTHSLTTRTNPATYGVAPDDASALTVQMASTSTAVTADNDPTQLAHQDAQSNSPRKSPPPHCDNDGTVFSTTGEGIVSEIHAVGNMNASSTYGNIADSQVQAGVDWQIPDSPLTLTGSVHVGNTTSITATINRGQSYGGDYASSVHAQIGMHKDKVECYAPYRLLYHIVASRWNGNTSLGSTNLLPYDHNAYAYPASQRWQYPPNSVVTHDSTTAITYSAGFAVPAWGLGLNIRSGFSSEVVKSYHFGGSTSSTEHWLYGDTGAPLQSGHTWVGWS